MPRFIDCYICGRKYTPFSIEIHEGQCLEKWHMENNKLPPKKRQVPPLKPGDQMQSFQPPERKANGITAEPPSSRLLAVNRNRKSDEDYDDDDSRPGTVTISGRSASSTNLNGSFTYQRNGNEPPHSSSSAASYSSGSGNSAAEYAAENHRRYSTGGVPNTRVCFVCGQRVGRNSIEIHEKKCLRSWTAIVNELPDFMRVQEPTKLQPPSVDGSIDHERLDTLATQTAYRAQKADCMKCKKSFQLAKAKEHARACARNGPPATAAERGRKQIVHPSPIDNYLNNHATASQGPVYI